MRIGSLFSGIGGLELGLEWSGLGDVVWQVEKDAYCRAVLAKHWPQAERLEDVCTVGKHNLAAVDLICGGFPCQDVSSAGKGEGLAGERSGLWRQYARIVSELRPRWVVVENVTSGAHRWLDTVVRELEVIGYASLFVPLSAFDVGAPHLRRRLFIVAADADGAALRNVEQRQPTGRGTDRIRDARLSLSLSLGGSAAGLNPDANPNAEYDLAEHAEVASASKSANALRSRFEGSGAGTHEGRSGSAENAWGTSQPEFLRVADGISNRVDRPRRRIAALGNAVVPQCGEVIGWIIREIEASCSKG